VFSADGILGRNFGIMAAGLDGLTMRQQVHAENLSNVNTEGYNAKTVSFEGSLRAAMAAPKGASLATAAPGVSPAAVGDARIGGHLASRFASTQRRGGGEVSKTQEVQLMMNDNIRYRVLTQQVTNRISELRSVISEMGRG
jgi:flagellar basal-body rod protein FlgB